MATNWIIPCNEQLKQAHRKLKWLIISEMCVCICICGSVCLFVFVSVYVCSYLSVTVWGWQCWEGGRGVREGEKRPENVGSWEDFYYFTVVYTFQTYAAQGHFSLPLTQQKILMADCNHLSVSAHVSIANPIQQGGEENTQWAGAWINIHHSRQEQFIRCNIKQLKRYLVTLRMHFIMYNTHLILYKYIIWKFLAFTLLTQKGISCVTLW